MAEPVHPLKLASLFLGYPSAPLRQAAEAAESIEIAPASRSRERTLREFCRWYAATPLSELEARYVEVFDFTKHASLHLTYHVHGDRRQRGMAMLELKQAYRAAGLEPPGDELPDYLPLMLEFAAVAPAGEGERLLEEHRVAIELVRGGLKREDSPFLPLLEVVVAGLGKLSGRKLARIRKIAAEGPPHEEVGLEPFAPPEVMPAGAPEQARPLVGGWEAR
jgi:nitrate reductase delta subunit